MGRRFDFTVYLVDERDEITRSLTQDEAAVFAHRAHGESVIQTSLALCQSERTVKRRSASVVRKIEKLHKAARRE